MTPNNKRNNKTLSAFLLHLHPPKVHSETLRISLSFGLGGMAVTLLFALFFTGIVQLLSYSPQVHSAHHSVQQMYTHGGLAGFVRNIHHWSGNLLVILVFLHMLRVLFTGALTGGRRYNWLIGIVLFITVLFANFTGYLMPWDQLAYWAVTIFTSMAAYLPFCGEQVMLLLRGGPEVGAETLAVFFAIHVGIIPVALLILSLYHFWLVRKAGGLIRVQRDTSSPVEMVPTVPCLVLRELAVGLALLAVMLIFSAFVDAPLGSEANPGESPNPTKAAWYFMGLQELLLHIHPIFAICLVPLIMVGGLMSLPFWKETVLPGGLWFGGGKGSRVVGWSILAGLGCIAMAVLVDDMMLSNGISTEDTWLLRGLVPLVGYTVVVTGWFLWWRVRIGCSRAEATTGMVVFVFATTVGLTLTGIWFRGAKMSLILPFKELL